MGKRKSGCIGHHVEKIYSVMQVERASPCRIKECVDEVKKSADLVATGNEGLEGFVTTKTTGPWLRESNAS